MAGKATAVLLFGAIPTACGRERLGSGGVRVEWWRVGYGRT
ncbi:MAG: hypothetical protein OT477_03040 [Chloroflexi bacterium]|nr:hypothetical protein [Chloroflexota bacterium]